MSTGKRLAKRSIVGTRVCAPGGDGKYYSAVIHAVRNPTKEDTMDKKNTINLTPTTRYAVRFDSRQGNVGRTTAEFSENDLIGPGFQSVLGVELVPGQKCFVTYNGREVRGEVCKHHAETDEVIITIHPAGAEAAFEVQKKLEDVRLLESRKSARLADQDTDFARLADMAGDRKRGSMDVPVNTGSRKRRPSSSYDDDPMDECSAALVLMSLSGSPQSPFFFYEVPHSRKSPGSTSSSTSFRSTPSPPPRTCSPNSVPLSSSSVSDEGIITDYYPVKQPRKKKGVTRAAYQCTWRTCVKIANTAESIQAHIRHEHLKDKICEYAEEDFYYKEIDFPYTSPSPTLSHRDMARPFHEDPDYQRQLVGSMRQSLLISPNQPIPQSSPKIIKLSRRSNSPKTSPRRVRGDNRKCRKVYGMNSRDSWCTQCKWKKACTRFAEWSVVLKCHKNTTN